jgi:hypothetical protein
MIFTANNLSIKEEIPSSIELSTSTHIPPANPPPMTPNVAIPRTFVVRRAMILSICGWLRQEVKRKGDTVAFRVEGGYRGIGTRSHFIHNDN